MCVSQIETPVCVCVCVYTVCVCVCSVHGCAAAVLPCACEVVAGLCVVECWDFCWVFLIPLFSKFNRLSCKWVSAGCCRGGVSEHL